MRDYYMKYKNGQKVHVDSDNAEWGRVASDATVIEDQGKEVLVTVDSIQADIFVLKTEVNPR
jgi:hypothetical protein